VSVLVENNVALILYKLAFTEDAVDLSPATRATLDRDAETANLFLESFTCFPAK